VCVVNDSSVGSTIALTISGTTIVTVGSVIARNTVANCDKATNVLVTVTTRSVPTTASTSTGSSTNTINTSSVTSTGLIGGENWQIAHDAALFLCT